MDDASRAVNGDAEGIWLNRRHHLKLTMNPNERFNQRLPIGKCSIEAKMHQQYGQSDNCLELSNVRREVVNPNDLLGACPTKGEIVKTRRLTIHYESGMAMPSQNRQCQLADEATHARYAQASQRCCTAPNESVEPRCRAPETKRYTKANEEEAFTCTFIIGSIQLTKASRCNDGHDELTAK